MKKYATRSVSVAVFIFICLISFQTYTRAPEPKFKILAANHAIQIRAYPALTTVSCMNEGNREAVLHEAKSRLKTAFMASFSHDLSFNFPFPAMAQRVGDQRWMVSFIIPQDVAVKMSGALASAGLTLGESPPRKMAVIQFNGYNSNANLIAHLEKLQSFKEQTNLKTVGNPLLVSFNTGWTLPFMRRNEIMLEVV